MSRKGYSAFYALPSEKVGYSSDNSASSAAAAAPGHVAAKHHKK